MIFGILFQESDDGWNNLPIIKYISVEIKLGVLLLLWFIDQPLGLKARTEKLIF